MDFERLEQINDHGWSAATKCAIFEALGELRENFIDERKAKTAKTKRNKKELLSNLKQEIKLYRAPLNEGINYFKDEIFSDFEDRTLVERYRYLHPNDIISSIKRTINGINYEANQVRGETEKRLNQLESIMKGRGAPGRPPKDYHDYRQVARDSTSIDDKIIVASLNKRKMKEILNYAGDNDHAYDSLLIAVHKEAEEMATHLMNQIDETSKSNRDANEIAARIKNFRELAKKLRIKQMLYVDRFTCVMDSLEQNRKELMTEEAATELEKSFLSELPWSTKYSDDDDDDDNYLFSSSKKPIALKKKNSWFKNVSKFGLKYYYDRDELIKILDNMKNHENSSSIDYEIPEDIDDYITFHNIHEQTQDDLAVYYLLRKSKFSSLEELLEHVKFIKNRTIHMKKMKAATRTAWKFLVKEESYIGHVIEQLEFLSDEEVEFDRQEEVLKSHIDGKKEQIAKIEEQIDGYYKLYNEYFFHVDHLRNMLQDFNIPLTTGVHDELDSLDKTTTSDEQLRDTIEELKSMMNETYEKIICCQGLIPNNFDMDKFDLSHAIYDFRFQDDAQWSVFKERIYLKKQKFKNPVAPQQSLPVILTREESKRRANQMVELFETKDSDFAKNKRKPISFRKSYI